MEKREMEGVLHDTIIEAPLQFEAGGRKFCMHPKSLGLTLLLGRLRESLGIDGENARLNPMLEMLRVCEAKRDVVLRMISYAVLKDKEKVFDPGLVDETMAFLGKSLDAGDMATLLAHLLRDEQDVTQILRGHFKIDQELEDKRKVVGSKAGNTITFGGKTIYGTLLDFIAQRYGWTLQHMVWETSYNNLMMMYYDHTDSVYLSDEEKKGFGPRMMHRNDDMIVATKENMEQIKSMGWQ